MNKHEVVHKRILLGSVVLLLLVRCILFMFYPLMDNTEARYAEISRKMVELSDWVTPWYDYHVPFWGKPPLSFWLTAVSFKLLGVNEFSARLPHWLCGVFVAWLVWDWVKRYSQQQALYVLALLVGSLMYFTAAGAVMTDMALLVGTTLAMRGFWLGLFTTANEQRFEKWLLFLGVAIGLLAKGPLTFVLVGVPIVLWAVLTRNVVFVWRNLPWVKGFLVVTGLVLPWYLLAEYRTPGFLNYFIIGEHWHRFVTPGWSGDLYGTAHSFPRGAIWIFSFADFLPWSVLLPIAALCWKNAPTLSIANQTQRQFTVYLWVWFLTPLLFFTTAGNILWTYMLPGWPALACLTSMWLHKKNRTQHAEQLLIGGIMLVLVGVITSMTIFIVMRNDELTSTKALVEDYQRHKTDTETLIFVGNKPYSADFYTQGKAIVVENLDELTQKIKQDSNWVAIKKETQAGLPPDVTKKLQFVSEHGRLELYHVVQ